MLNESPDDLFLKYAIAMEYLGSDNKVLAKEKFLEVIKVDPNYTSAYYQLALIAIESKDESEALNYLSVGIKTTQNAKTRNEFRSLMDEINF